uniref:Transmembrane protein n=1 Tax=Steinernema glaseri TaxID=37863 RepID=A0A1I8ALB8_9BILA
MRLPFSGGVSVVLLYVLVVLATVTSAYTRLSFEDRSDSRAVSSNVELDETDFLSEERIHHALRSSLQAKIGSLRRVRAVFHRK